MREAQKHAESSAEHQALEHARQKVQQTVQQTQQHLTPQEGGTQPHTNPKNWEHIVRPQATPGQFDPQHPHTEGTYTPQEIHDAFKDKDGHAKPPEHVADMLRQLGYGEDAINSIKSMRSKWTPENDAEPHLTSKHPTDDQRWEYLAKKAAWIERNFDKESGTPLNPKGWVDHKHARLERIEPWEPNQTPSTDPTKPVSQLAAPYAQKLIDQQREKTERHPTPENQAEYNAMLRDYGKYYGALPEGRALRDQAHSLVAEKLGHYKKWNDMTSDEKSKFSPEEKSIVLEARGVQGKFSGAMHYLHKQITGESTPHGGNPGVNPGQGHTPTPPQGDKGTTQDGHSAQGNSPSTPSKPSSESGTPSGDPPQGGSSSGEVTPKPSGTDPQPSQPHHGKTGGDDPHMGNPSTNPTHADPSAPSNPHEDSSHGSATGKDPHSGGQGSKPTTDDSSGGHPTNPGKTDPHAPAPQPHSVTPPVTPPVTPVTPTTGGNGLPAPDRFTSEQMAKRFGDSTPKDTEPLLKSYHYTDNAIEAVRALRKSGDFPENDPMPVKPGDKASAQERQDWAAKMVSWCDRNIDKGTGLKTGPGWGKINIYSESQEQQRAYLRSKYGTTTWRDLSEPKRERAKDEGDAELFKKARNSKQAVGDVTHKTAKETGKVLTPDNVGKIIDGGVKLVSGDDE